MRRMIFGIVLFLFVPCVSYAQSQPQNLDAAILKIVADTARISYSLEQLNKQMANFAQTFSSNQGLRLTDRQQKLLFAFEMLNRAESRLSTLQLMKVTLADREATTKRRITEVEERLRTENIDRTIGGALDAEQVRAQRRRALETERSDLVALLAELQNTIRDADGELAQIQTFIRRIRGEIFPAAYDELKDL